MENEIIEISKILSKSEVAILHLVADNHNCKQIGSILNITPKTVENHRSNICKKLKITGQNALLIYALQHKNEIQNHLK